MSRAGAVIPAEHEIQRRWANADVPRWLHSESGQRLRLLYAGSWNHGPGPDFRRARLCDGEGRVLHGDVEIHRRPSDWRAHGHGADPAYDAVVLHVVGAATPAAADAPACVVCLPDRGEVPAAAAALPCADIVGRAGRRAVAAKLEQVAVARLARKAARISRWAAACRGRGASAPQAADQAAYIALLSALGRGDNRPALERLARRLPLHRLQGLRGEEAVRAVLVDAAAQLEQDGELRWSRRGRPANRPAARLRLAAALLHVLGPQALSRRLTALALRDPARAIEDLRLPRLLGVDGATQLLVDCCYPFTLATAPLRPPDRDALVRRWLCLPGGAYLRTQPLHDRLAAQAPIPSLGPARRPNNGTSQALLDLERHYCRHGGCVVCPLARLAAGPAAGWGPRASALPSTNLAPGDVAQT